VFPSHEPLDTSRSTLDARLPTLVYLLRADSWRDFDVESPSAQWLCSRPMHAVEARVAAVELHRIDTTAGRSYTVRHVMSLVVVAA